jgi:hypothetical protein
MVGQGDDGNTSDDLQGDEKNSSIHRVSFADVSWGIEQNSAIRQALIGSERTVLVLPDEKSHLSHW